MLENIDFDGERRDEEKVSSFLSGFSELKDVEIFRIGDYSYHGKGDFPLKRVDKIIEQTNKLVAMGEHTPPCKTSHDYDNRGQPVPGWWTNFRRKGKIVLGDLRTTAKGFHDWIKSGGFREKSIEFWTDKNPYYGPSGKLTDIIKAVTFVPNPECKGLLPSFADLAYDFSDQPAETIIFTEGDEMGEEDKTKKTEDEKKKEEEKKADDAKGDEGKGGDGKGSDDKKTDDEGGDDKSGDGKDDKGSDDKGSEDDKVGDDKGDGSGDGDGGGNGDMSDGKGKTVSDLGGYIFPNGSSGKEKSDTGLKEMKINVTNFGDESTIKETVGGMTDEERIARLEKVEADTIKAKVADGDRFLDDMVKKGKAIPAQRDLGRILLHPANDNVSFDFGEKDGKPQIMTVREAFKKFIEAGSKQVDFNESAKDGSAGEDAPDAKTGKADELTDEQVEKTVDSFFDKDEKKEDGK